jgi:O-antigen/teichoic acid export membrane protein
MHKTVRGKSVLSGMFWSFGERITAQLVTFIITIILARILTPGDYGAVSLILVFITLANVFVSNGFGESLIQKQNATERDFSTIFWCSFAFSIVLYTILFFAAPYISEFYGIPMLRQLLRVLALKLPISSLSTIQHAYVSKHMQFKKFFLSTIGGTLISGIVGVAMAYNGFGPWAIVAQYLVNTTIDTIVLLFTVPWRPRFWFEWDSAKTLMGFGWKMMLSAFINSAYGEIRSLIIGKVYSSEDLAQYKRGQQFPHLFITNINTAVSSVIFPAISLVNNDISAVKRLTRKSMIVTSYLVFPIMVGLGVIAEPLVKFLLTDKWLPCVPFLRLACISYALQPIQTANCQAIKSIGRSDVYLKMEIAKKTIGIGLLVAFMKRSVMAIAITDVVAVAISAIISIMPNKKLIGYTYKEQILDLVPSIILCAIMGLVVYPLGKLPMPTLVICIFQVIVGATVYYLLSRITKNEAFVYLMDTIKSVVNKGKKHA